MTNKLGVPVNSGFSFDSSRGAVLQLLFDSKELTRANISRVSGLSKQTISSVMADLEELSLVEETGITEGGIGRRAITYRLSPNAGYAFGIDLGGTNFRAGVINFLGEIVDEVSHNTPHESFEDLLRIMEQVFGEFQRKHDLDPKNLAHITIGIPGDVDPATGLVRHSPNIPYLINQYVSQRIRERFLVPVLVENDVNIAALGELERSDSRDFGFVALGTGIGMGLILEGELRRGFSGGAGEIAYMPLGANQNEKSISGHTEELVGGIFLEKTYQERTGKKLNLAGIFDLADQGDPIASTLKTELIDNLALSIKSIQSILDLDEIVFGGGIGSRDDIITQLRQKLSLVMEMPPRIRISKLGSRAGLIGALSYALLEMQRKALMSGKLTKES